MTFSVSQTMDFVLGSFARFQSNNGKIAIFQMETFSAQNVFMMKQMEPSSSFFSFWPSFFSSSILLHCNELTMRYWNSIRVGFFFYVVLLWSCRLWPNPFECNIHIMWREIYEYVLLMRHFPWWLNVVFMLYQSNGSL